LLRRLVEQLHHTVLLVTHSAAAADAADYTWTMKDGRLVTRTGQKALSVGA
jgi:ABC-type lipoprotein export system ATPase subunit